MSPLDLGCVSVVCGVFVILGEGQVYFLLGCEGIRLSLCVLGADSVS